MSRFYTDEVTSYRYSSTRGVGGELVKTWTTSVTVTGSFQSQSGTWNYVNDKEAYRQNKTFFCPIVDITENDYLLYGSQRYDILDVKNMFNHHLEIELEIRSS